MQKSDVVIVFAIYGFRIHDDTSLECQRNS